MRVTWKHYFRWERNTLGGSGYLFCRFVAKLHQADPFGWTALPPPPYVRTERDQIYSSAANAVCRKNIRNEDLYHAAHKVSLSLPLLLSHSLTPLVFITSSSHASDTCQQHRSNRTHALFWGCYGRAAEMQTLSCGHPYTRKLSHGAYCHFCANWSLKGGVSVPSTKGSEQAKLRQEVKILGHH